MWWFRRQHADSQALSAERGHITRRILGVGLWDAQCGEVIVPRETAASGDFLPASGRLQDEADVDAEARQHVDEAVGAEQIDPPSEHVADAWLRDAQEFRGLGLRQSSRRDGLLQLDQQVGTNQQVLGFVGGEAEIAEHIAA